MGLKGSGVLLPDTLEDFGLVDLLLISFSPLRSKLPSVSQFVRCIVLLNRFGNWVWIFSFFQWFLRPWWTGGRRRCYYSETVLISSRDLHNATGIFLKKPSGSRACAYHLPGIWREQFLPTQQCAVCWMYHCYMNFSTGCGKRDSWINEQMRLGKWNDFKSTVPKTVTQLHQSSFPLHGLTTTFYHWEGWNGKCKEDIH